MTLLPTDRATITADEAAQILAIGRHFAGVLRHYMLTSPILAPASLT